MKKRNKKGFTLVEMIAAVAIFSIIAVALTTMITTMVKFNSLNKKTFDSNSNSRAFYETIRGKRPSASNKYPISSNYYTIYFNDQNELVTFVKDNFNDTLSGQPREKSFDDLKSSAGGKRYVIQVYVEKKPVSSTVSYYELTTKSYDINKGKSTEIERKSIIAEE